MKALHEFKTEKAYKDYLMIYFAGKALASGSTLLYAIDISKMLIDKLDPYIKRPSREVPVKEIKDVVARKQEFTLSLQPFLKEYGRDMLKEFNAYWTEDSKDMKTFRMEAEKSWTLSRRLETWKKNNSNGYKSPPQTNGLQGTI